jgi:two-component system, OmpR family, response regulator
VTLKVLYVDDEADIREVAALSLELEPSFDVATAGSGAEAIEKAGKWRPDVILLDVMMPGMDGPTTLERLRALAATESIPIVFVTARTQQQEVETLKSLGAAGVIAKPFDPMSLAQQVRELVFE